MNTIDEPTELVWEMGRNGLHQYQVTIRTDEIGRCYRVYPQGLLLWKMSKSLYRSKRELLEMWVKEQKKVVRHCRKELKSAEIELADMQAELAGEN